MNKKPDLFDGILDALALLATIGIGAFIYGSVRCFDNWHVYWIFVVCGFVMFVIPFAAIAVYYGLKDWFDARRIDKKTRVEIARIERERAR